MAFPEGDCGIIARKGTCQIRIYVVPTGKAWGLHIPRTELPHCPTSLYILHNINDPPTMSCTASPSFSTKIAPTVATTGYEVDTRVAIQEYHTVGLGKPPHCPVIAVYGQAHLAKRS